MSASVHVTNLQDAKMMNTELKTPIVHWDFSRKFSKHWAGLVYAQLRLLNAVFEYDEVRQKACARKRRKVGHRLDDIAKTIRGSEVFAGKRGDANQFDQDRNEQDILAHFLKGRAVPFVEFWQQAVEALDHGFSLDIERAEIPIWFDERPE